jgi:hypothetical protein
VAREATTEANGDVDDPDEPLAERALHPYTAGIPEAEYILETLRSRSHGR